MIQSVTFLSDTYWLILVTAYGACVGSFLNVVIYRLPEGQSLVTPGSHCPKCNRPIAWYDNIPILSYLLLRGRCRHCRSGISIRYPLVELVTAVLFGGLFSVYYFSDLRSGFTINGFDRTWLVLIVHLVLVGSLLASTAIDFQYYVIPLHIPWLVILLTVVVYPAGGYLALMPVAEGLVPVSKTMVEVGLGVGALLGLTVAMVLLHYGRIPRSFEEVEDELTEPLAPDEFLDHPHPRREVMKEVVFIAFPTVGAVLGFVLAKYVYHGSEPGPALQVLGGILSGFFVGGGIIWLTRIIGTLAFGREAMGLGDVHLLASIGVVLGALDTVFVFFIAPFFGLAAALIMAGLSSLLRGKLRVIPYGPYLAGASLFMMVFREPVLAFFNILY